MEITWKKVGFEDEEIIKKYYEREQTRSCEFTFANNILWSPHYKIQYAVVEDMLVFLADEKRFAVSFPLGKKNVKEAILALMQYFEEQGKPFMMYSVTREQFEKLEELFPGQFQIEYDRDLADYVYESEKLISLSGKKLHAKRNHINKFMAEHENWSYESITEANKEECLEMAKEWCEVNGCKEDEEKSREICVTFNALKYKERLGLTGGLIRLNGKVIAITLGEECCKDTFVVHIEKAFADIQGAYPMINQQFVKHEASQYHYINREEDTGAEGLRKAKLSYRPAFLQEKGVVTHL